MVKARAATVMAGMLGDVGPMNKIGAKGFYFRTAGRMSWSKKRVIMANLPYTIEKPHPGQAQTRIHFAKVAAQTRGTRDVTERNKIVAEGMYGYRAELAMNPADYPSRQSYHTADQLRSMLDRYMKQKRPGKVGRKYPEAVPMEFGI